MKWFKENICGNEIALIIISVISLCVLGFGVFILIKTLKIHFDKELNIEETMIAKPFDSVDIDDLYPVADVCIFMHLDLREELTQSPLGRYRNTFDVSFHDSTKTWYEFKKEYCKKWYDMIIEIDSSKNKWFDTIIIIKNGDTTKIALEDL